MDIKEPRSLSVERSARHDRAGLDRLKILMHGQSEVLEMISAGASLISILDTIVSWVELQASDSFFASILLLDEEGKHLLHGAAPSLPEAYNQAIHGVTIGENVGSCGTAAFTGETVIVDDIATDVRWQDYRDLALSFNLHACWSTPLLAKTGKVLGTFAIYYQQSKKPAFDDLEIIKLVSRTAVIAIEHSRNSGILNTALAQSEKRFRSLVYEAPVATSIYLGYEMVIGLANDAMLKLWGKDSSVIGKHLHEGLPELEGQPFLELLRDVFTSGQAYSAKDARADLVVDGVLQPFYFNFTYKPLRDTNGEIYAILNMAVDVTESVTARIALEESENRYRTLATELENRVQERTYDLQLANESLEKSNAELAQYAYVASHDLQEPLRKIRVFSSMLMDRNELTEDAISLLSRVMSSADRMSQLINDLLEFSRLLNAGKSMQTVDLNEALQNVLQDFELAIKEKNAGIIVGNLPVIDAIPLQVNQLFNNLLSNAFKFSKGDVRLEINVQSRTLAKDECRLLKLQKGLLYHEITFADNGIGFDPKFAEQIFEVFKRLHSKQAYPGSGIGLALCRKILETHQGLLFAKSQEGKGTVFHIVFPEKQL